MAHNRLLKPEFFQDEVLSSLPAHARLLYQGLWCHADRRGVLEDRPLRLRAVIFPYEQVDLDALLSVLAEQGFVERYQANGLRCLYLPKFTRHQRPHPHEPESDLPLPDRVTGAVCSDKSLHVIPKEALGSVNQDQDQDQDREGVARARELWITPTLAQVQNYAGASGRPELAEPYFDYRASVGWEKGGHHVSDWQADFRGWVRNEDQRIAEGRSTVPPPKYVPTAQRLRTAPEGAP